MAMGPKELQRRQQREARAMGSAARRQADQKKSKASPALEVKGAEVAPVVKPTAATQRARQGEDALTKTFLITIPTAVDARLERTRIKRGYRSRAQVVVALLDEGAEK